MTTAANTAANTAATAASWDDGNEALFRARTRPQGWQNPVPRDIYDLVVIGAGPAGLQAVDRARRAGFSVALVERNRIGGTSLDTGTIPSKSLVHAGRVGATLIAASDRSGTDSDTPARMTFAMAMSRLRRAQARVAAYHGAADLARMGVDIFFGVAGFEGEDSLRVAGALLRFRTALIATGARPGRPDIPGLDTIDAQTSATIFDMPDLPRRLAVIGGGPLGCEMAQAFQRLGAQVSIIEVNPKFLPGEERDAAELLSRAMARDGVVIRLNTTITAARLDGGVKVLETINAGITDRVEADEVLVCVGRVANVEGLGLDAAGVATRDDGCVAVDAHLCTTNPRIYAAGDVCMDLKFTNVAAVSARLAVDNALAGGRQSHHGLVIPWCTYCDPEIAHIGVRVCAAEGAAGSASLPLKTYTVMMQDVDRAIIDDEDLGFIKIHVAPGTDRILGATIMAERASEMINEMAVVMQAGIGMAALAQTVHTYPAQSGGIAMAALEFMRQRAADG